MNLTTLRPGLLVSLKTSVTGNVSYNRTDIETDHLTEDGQKRAKWETERLVSDPKEFEGAHAVRSKCRLAIYKVCAASTFGLLCPEDRKADLDAAVKQAQEMAAEFNSTATLTSVRIYVIAGRIAADDLQAVKAINSEVRNLLSDMETGLRKLDVRAVREAANKAKSIGQMLSPEAASRIKEAVDSARDMAKQIVKAGEEASVAIDQSALKKLAESRTAFLDYSDEDAVINPPATEGRAVDLEPQIPLRPAKTAPPAIELE